MFYICRPCNAWVGVQQGTDKAMGRLANAELRSLRRFTHRWFDSLAVDGLIDDFYDSNINGINTRQKACLRLAAELGIQPGFCHIGMFDEEECKRVIAICQPIVESLDGTGDIW